MKRWCPQQPLWREGFSCTMPLALRVWSARHLSVSPGVAACWGVAGEGLTSAAASVDGRGSRTKKLRGLGYAVMIRLGEEAALSALCTLGLSGDASEPDAEPERSLQADSTLRQLRTACQELAQERTGTRVGLVQPGWAWQQPCLRSHCCLLTGRHRENTQSPMQLVSVASAQPLRCHNTCKCGRHQTDERRRTDYAPVAQMARCERESLPHRRLRGYWQAVQA